MLSFKETDTQTLEILRDKLLDVFYQAHLNSEKLSSLVFIITNELIKRGINPYMTNDDILIEEEVENEL